ncbi:endothelial differentiation-related factor 1 isoform X1 [Arvicanthis niloticus]|uniref:endothelial differentiation-related factor 1 isoform X1 n=1 Tax=Arvicanthis niloticus TaxID=61156 RepID=UPI00402B72E0
MAESDWDTVTVLRKKGPTAAQAKSKQAILAAQRRGEDVETSKKWAAGQNKQHSITKNTAKLDRETEELHHDRVTLEVGKVIQRGRQSKGLTQKDLATKINEKPQVIADYESGRAIPNNQVLGKIERAIVFWLSWIYVDRLVLSSWRSVCLCLLCPGIKGVCHHVWLRFYFLYRDLLWLRLASDSHQSSYLSLLSSEIAGVSCHAQPGPYPFLRCLAHTLMSVVKAAFCVCGGP